VLARIENSLFNSKSKLSGYTSTKSRNFERILIELHIFTDGGSRGNPGPAAIGGVVYADVKNGEVVHDFSEYLGVGTNNEAEYTALLTSAQWVSQYVSNNSVEKCTWNLDSKLVVEQIQKHWKIKEPRMRVFAEQCWHLLDGLGCDWKIQYVPRAENAVADSLVNQALDAQAA